MRSAEFLLEIGTEEVPDWMIPGALNDLKRRFVEALAKHELRGDFTCTVEATPRRLVLVAEEIPVRQADREETLTGPPRSIAYDSAGRPTKAAEGFARRTGVPVEDLRVGEDDRLTVKRQIAGRPTAEILSEVLPDVVLGIYFPKTMYWTSKSGPRFIRPIRWLLALFDGEVVPFELAGVRPSSRTAGHRRLGLPELEVSGWKDYQEKLRQNFVIVSVEERGRKIEAEIAEVVPAGQRIRSNLRLLEALVHLTEFPTPLLGAFDAEYLSLPEEVLETVMQHHQKYFAVEDAAGRLQPQFVAVANLSGDPEGVIRRGHERVLRARFNDARFFWETDLKIPLHERVEELKSVTYQAKLGSYFDKTQRNQRLVQALATGVGLPDGSLRHALRAAELAKCDLTTELVGEFPELQGIVGGLYAQVQGEPPEVYNAVYDHYRPVGAEDQIPRGAVGQIVAIADKLDALGGLFRLGMIPSGSKDPFALRRAAYGIIRILIEGAHRLSIDGLCGVAEPGEGAEALPEFFLDRLRYYLKDVRGHRYDEVNAVLSASARVPLDVAVRTEAIARVRPTANFEPLAISFKRIKNILIQAGGVERFASRVLDQTLLENGAESELYTAFHKLKPRVAESKDRGDYAAALTAIASLRPAVDLFFDNVLVMAQQERVRENRLTLLAHLLREFSTIADFAEIVSA